MTLPAASTSIPPRQKITDGNLRKQKHKKVLDMLYSVIVKYNSIAGARTDRLKPL